MAARAHGGVGRKLQLSASFEREAHEIPGRTGLQGGSKRAYKGPPLVLRRRRGHGRAICRVCQVMPGRSVRFVKLYSDFGWTCKGRIVGVEGGGWCLEGQ